MGTDRSRSPRSRTTSSSSKVVIPAVTIEEVRESNSLSSSSLSERIQAALGPDGPGVICVTGGSSDDGRAFVEEVRRIRAEYLPMAQRLTRLPPESVGRLEDPEALFVNGLAKGKEVTDRAKSSFYYHPWTDTPGDHVPAGAERPPLFYNRNMFPTDEELPGFKAAARTAGQFVVSIGNEVSQVIDRHCSAKMPGYPAGALASVVRVGPNSNHKCRLILYHPYESEEEVQKTGGMWAAEHLDTGSLTGLVPGVFLDDDGRAVPSPDPSSGLYVLDRKGQRLQALKPEGVDECLFFQVGEALQIVSGASVQATPHFVKGPAIVHSGVCRATLAVFMQPHCYEELPSPAGMSYADIAQQTSDCHLPKAWPSLRWRFEKLQEEGKLGSGQTLTFGLHGNITISGLTSGAND